MSETVKSTAVWRILARGFSKLCPKCGKASIYERYLKPTPACSSCGEKYDHIRTDDFAPWLTLIALGHLFVPLVYHLETTYRPPLVLLFSILKLSSNSHFKYPTTGVFSLVPYAKLTESDRLKIL